VLVRVIVIDRIAVQNGNTSPALMKADYEHEHEHENAYDWSFMENRIKFFFAYVACLARKLFFYGFIKLDAFAIS
jgi:hypothetical protein